MCSGRDSRFVTKWWAHVRRFQVAREKDTPFVTTTKFVQFGVGITTTKREIEEKALRTPLRSSSTGDSLLVGLLVERNAYVITKRLMIRRKLYFKITVIVALQIIFLFFYKVSGRWIKFFVVKSIWNFTRDPHFWNLLFRIRN